jgi:aldehyde:ferredoxin oxidoreductase
MVITFFGPFEKLAEKELRIELQEPISTHEISQMFAFHYYACRNWAEDGIPTRGKSEEVGLEEL